MILILAASLILIVAPLATYAEIASQGLAFTSYPLKNTTEEQCLESNAEYHIAPDATYIVRLSSLSYDELPNGAYLQTFICEHPDDSHCTQYMYSKIQSTMPITVTLSGHDLGCVLATGKILNKKYKYISVRVFKYGTFYSKKIFESYTKIKDLEHTVEIIETDLAVIEIYATQ